MIFKELMQKDVKNTFLNPKEFGKEHIVNGKKMLVVIDDNELIERKKTISQHMDGIYANQKLLYVATSDFKTRPARDSVLWLDGESYRVVNTVSEGSIYSITIEVNRGR